MKIKKGDTVLIISGKDRRKTGKVLRVFPKENRVVIEGLNVKTRHRRARRAGQKGQRVSIPVPFSASNVMIVCPKCGKAARIGYRLEGEKKFRVCKKCGADLT